MFINRKIRTGKAYAYRIFECFKTSVTYKKKKDLTPDNYVHFEVAFVGNNSFFFSRNDRLWIGLGGITSSEQKTF